MNNDVFVHSRAGLNTRQWELPASLSSHFGYEREVLLKMMGDGSVAALLFVDKATLQQLPIPPALSLINSDPSGYKPTKGDGFWAVELTESYVMLCDSDAILRLDHLVQHTVVVLTPDRKP